MSFNEDDLSLGFPLLLVLAVVLLPPPPSATYVPFCPVLGKKIKSDRWLVDKMEAGSEGSALLLLDLDVEILGMVIGWIDTELLYPHCFLVNRYCFEALKYDLIWKERCNKDLEIFELFPSLNWMQTYKGV